MQVSLFFCFLAALLFVKTNIFNIQDPNDNITILKEEEHEHNEDVIGEDWFKNNFRREIVANPAAPAKRVYRALL